MTEEGRQGTRRGWARTAQAVATGCLVCSAVVAIVASVRGVAITWPLRLVIAGNITAFASTVVQPTRPALRDCLVLVGGLLSIAAIIALVVMRP